MLTHINEITMTTVEIAAMTGKQHKNVLRDADRIVEQVAHLKSEAGSVEATTTMLTTNQTELLPIVIEGQTFKPNEDGMWNLNEIAKALNVREPGQWRNAVQAALIKDANLHVSHGNGTLATEEGAIAYAVADELRASANLQIIDKHASHVIIIEGQAFKADDHGRWDLTDIWRTLKLPKGKQPGQWNNLKEGQYMREMGFSHSAKAGAVTATHANKRATLAYAGWVSRAFETMVYDAFEAILELPEVALLVADKMTALGNDHSATILKRHVFNDKCDWMALKRHHTNSQEGLRNAVQRGNLTHERAVELGLKLGVTR